MKNFFFSAFISIAVLSCKKPVTDEKPVCYSNEEIKLYNEVIHSLLWDTYYGWLFVEEVEQIHNGLEDVSRPEDLDKWIEQLNKEIEDIKRKHAQENKAIIALDLHSEIDDDLVDVLKSLLKKEFKNEFPDNSTHNTLISGLVDFSSTKANTDWKRIKPITTIISII